MISIESLFILLMYRYELTQNKMYWEKNISMTFHLLKSKNKYYKLLLCDLILHAWKGYIQVIFFAYFITELDFKVVVHHLLTITIVTLTFHRRKCHAGLDE